MKENYESLVDRLNTVLAEDDLIDVDLAYKISKYAHRHDVRKEIDPETNKPLRYFEHPRRVILLIVDYIHCYDPTVIISALLHDSIEDTRAVYFKGLCRWFGREVANIVKLLSKTPQNKDTYVQNLIDASDWRALLIKTADRYDNLRSLDDTSKDFQRRQIEETKEKYYPLFNRLLEICPKKFKHDISNLIANIQDVVQKYTDELES